MALLCAESRLLVLLNLARLTPATRAEIASLAASPSLDWKRVETLGVLNAVVPLSLKHLEEAGAVGLMPAESRKCWQELSEKIRTRGEARRVHASRLLTALAAAGVETIALKGSLFADALYADPSYKKMNDVDLMVRFEDAGRALDVLRGLGFQSVGKLLGREEIEASSHHTPPFVTDDLSCVVGMHWGLTAPHAPWKPDTRGIWRRSLAATAAGAPCRRMSWEDNLLHLCIHLPFFKIGLRELADVYNVILFAPGGIDWEIVSKRASAWHAEDAMYRVMALTHALIDGLGLPDHLLKHWKEKASRFTREDTALRVADPDRILRSRSTQVSKIEKAYAIFKLSHRYSEKAQAYFGMWAFLLWPKKPELSKIADQEKLESRRALARARLQAPAKIWRAMAREHGGLALSLMTASNAVSLAKATARRPFTADGKSLREHPAAPLLEALE